MKFTGELTDSASLTSYAVKSCIRFEIPLILEIHWFEKCILSLCNNIHFKQIRINIEIMLLGYTLKKIQVLIN